MLGRLDGPIVARVAADGMLARTASTAAIVASVAGDGMWAVLTAAIEARVVADGMWAGAVIAPSS